jgi:hypothetical protein
MKLEIVFKDPKHCDGCPCQNSDLEDGLECNLGYYGCYLGVSDDYRVDANGKGHSFRPQKCIDEHGE